MQTTIVRRTNDVDNKCLVRLVRGDKVFIVEGGSPQGVELAADPFAYAAANVLLDNSEHAPVFEVFGTAEFEVAADSIAAASGKGSVELFSNGTGMRVRLWRAFPVPAGYTVRVKGSPVYVAFKGLRGMGPGKRKVRAYAELEAERLNGKGDLKDLKARYVPSSFIHEARLRKGLSELLTLLEKMKRHIRLACEAARRGAKLVRVRVNGRLVDVWVEEVIA